MILGECGVDLSILYDTGIIASPFVLYDKKSKVGEITLKFTWKTGHEYRWGSLILHTESAKITGTNLLEPKLYIRFKLGKTELWGPLDL